MRNDVFQFHVQKLACGWCNGDTLINGDLPAFQLR